MERTNLGNSPTANIMRTGDVIYIWKRKTGSSSRLDEEVVQDKRQRDDNDLHDETQNQLEEDEVEPQRSKRARTEKSFRPDFISFMVENKPTSYREAELVDLPPDCKPLGYKWIFKNKMKADGTIDKYKARLVIKGYRQREGLYYFDSYSPVTRITSIRMVLAIAALKKLEVHQMDVKTEFLNGDLEEEIYMNQPEGFIAPRQESKVCRLVNNDKMIKSTKDMLKLKFDMKDIGLADVILGIKIIQTHNRLVLSQAHYVDKSLNNHNVGDFSLARTPIDTSTRPNLAYAVSRLSRAYSTMYNGKSRHIRRRHNLRRQLLSTRVISIDYVKSKDNIADPLTKGLSRELVSKSSKGMGLKPLKE
ncbi:retrotransposon protein, putative, ty1-copia subclass [Tanacetum coccineum]